MSGGTLSPGNSPGILTTNGLSTTGGSINFEIGGLNAGTGAGFADQINVIGSVSLAGTTAIFSFVNGYTGFNPLGGGNEAYFLIKNDGVDPFAGVFAGIAEGDTVNVGGINYQATYTANAETGARTGGNDFALVPEPGTLLLMLFPALGFLRRRR